MKQTDLQDHNLYGIELHCGRCHLTLLEFDDSCLSNHQEIFNLLSVIILNLILNERLRKHVDSCLSRVNHTSSPVDNQM